MVELAQWSLSHRQQQLFQIKSVNGEAGASRRGEGELPFTACRQPTSRARLRGRRRGCGIKDAMMRLRDLVTPSSCRPARVSIASLHGPIRPVEPLAELMPASHELSWRLGLPL